MRIRQLDSSPFGDNKQRLKFSSFGIGVFVVAVVLQPISDYEMIGEDHPAEGELGNATIGPRID